MFSRFWRQKERRALLQARAPLARRNRLRRGVRDEVGLVVLLDLHHGSNHVLSGWDVSRVYHEVQRTVQDVQGGLQSVRRDAQEVHELAMRVAVHGNKLVALRVQVQRRELPQPTDVRVRLALPGRQAARVERLPNMGRHLRQWLHVVDVRIVQRGAAARWLGQLRHGGRVMLAFFTFK